MQSNHFALGFLCIFVLFISRDKEKWLVRGKILKKFMNYIKWCDGFSKCCDIREVTLQAVQILENTNVWGWLSITSEHSWLFSYSITPCGCYTVLNWYLTLEFKITTQFILDKHYLCLVLLFLWLPQWTSQQSPGVWKPLKYRGEKQQQI